jgi:transposase
MRNSNVTIGMDVSDKYVHLAVIDDSGDVARRDRIPNREPAIRKWFAPYGGARVAMEVGPHSPWMSRLLSGVGMNVVLGNPREIKLISGSHRKNDPIDAEKLGRLARVDPKLLKPVHHRSEATQATLAIIRARDAAVRARTLLINAVRGQTKAVGGRIRSCKSEAFHKYADDVPEILRVALVPLFRSIRELNELIVDYDRRISALCNEVYPTTALFRQIWGVGDLTALIFLLTIENPQRFPSSRTVGAYFGLTPRQDQSGEVDKDLGITKAGDVHVRRLLVQCAHRILSELGPDSDLRRFGLRLVQHGGATKKAKRRAVVAVARKLAVLMHRLWITGEEYAPLRNASKAA